MPNYNVTTPVSESGWRDFSRDLFKFCSQAIAEDAISLARPRGMGFLEELPAGNILQKAAFSAAWVLPQVLPLAKSRLEHDQKELAQQFDMNGNPPLARI